MTNLNPQRRAPRTDRKELKKRFEKCFAAAKHKNVLLLSAYKKKQDVVELTNFENQRLSQVSNVEVIVYHNFDKKYLTCNKVEIVDEIPIQQDVDTYYILSEEASVFSNNKLGFVQCLCNRHLKESSSQCRFFIDTDILPRCCENDDKTGSKFYPFEQFELFFDTEIVDRDDYITTKGSIKYIYNGSKKKLGIQTLTYENLEKKLRKFKVNLSKLFLRHRSLVEKIEIQELKLEKKLKEDFQRYFYYSVNKNSKTFTEQIGYLEMFKFLEQEIPIEFELKVKDWRLTISSKTEFLDLVLEDQNFFQLQSFDPNIKGEELDDWLIPNAHHLYAKESYPSLAFIRSNLVKINQKMHQYLHSWHAKKTLTPEGFLKYISAVKTAYSDQIDLNLLNSEYRRKLPKKQEITKTQLQETYRFFYDEKSKSFPTLDKLEDFLKNKATPRIVVESKKMNVSTLDDIY